MLATRDVALESSRSPEIDTDVFDALRGATAESHRRLERDLDLLRDPLSKARVAEVLRRFLAFHLAWEPALARFAVLRDLLERRSRVDHLRRDLTRLGATATDVAPCAAAAALVRDAETALGSLYVMEGSTLGGKVISRALAGAPWLPPGGLTYFNPYGADTGAMWLTFKDRVRSLAAPAVTPDIVAGAVDCFALLHSELTPGLPA